MYSTTRTFQVFSDVYAVLNKNWKEKHHDRLCEILANVEHECGVEISFVKGAYQFRGTLKALSDVLKMLEGESDSSRVLPEINDVAQCPVQQLGDLPSGEDPGPDTVEDGVALEQPKSCTDMLPDRENAADDDGLMASTSDEKAVNQKTEPDIEQVEQPDSLTPTMSADTVTNDQLTKSLHADKDEDVGNASRGEQPVIKKDFIYARHLTDDDSPRTSTNDEKAVNQKTEPDIEQVKQPKNLTPTTSAPDSVIDDQPTKSLHADSSVRFSNHSNSFLAVQAVKHQEHRHNGDSECQWSKTLPQTDPSLPLHSSTPLCQSFEASADNHTNDRQHDTEMSAISESSTLPTLALSLIHI